MSCVCGTTHTWTQPCFRKECSNTFESKRILFAPDCSEHCGGIVGCGVATPQLCTECDSDYTVIGTNFGFGNFSVVEKLKPESYMVKRLKD